MLQHCGDIVGSLGVITKNPRRIHNDLRRRIAGIDHAALCAENDMLDISAGLVFQGQKLQSQLIGVLGSVRHLAHPLEGFLRSFRAERTACVIHKQTVTAFDVCINIVKLCAQSRQLSRVYGEFYSSDSTPSALVLYNIYHPAAFYKSILFLSSTNFFI